MLSIVVYGRNDNHGYNLHKRVALSLNCFAEILNDRDDEIVFVDYNTPDEHPSLVETIHDTLTDKARRTVRIIRAYPSVHRQYADKTPFPVVETIARNIGFRRTNPANRWVLSTNTDMILVPRKTNDSFNDILGNLDDGFYLLPRFELPEALWETVDRTRPADVISRVRRWGTEFAINEVINRPLVRYDAPGDFQLALRRDLFALSGMDERMLLGNVHVDSNLCRRMESRRGELRSLVDSMFGYHCAHTRTATMVHGRNKISNDFERFVREVKDWRLFEQDETWGQPEGVIEEISLPTSGSASLFERVLHKVIEPLDKSYEEIQWGTARREALRYSLDHMVPFLASSIAPLPKEYSLGLVPSRPDVVWRVVKLWTELGFNGQIGMRRSDLQRLTEIASLSDVSIAQRIVSYSDDEFYKNHDVYLFEFGLASEAPNGHATDTEEEVDGDQLSAVQGALERYMEVERVRTQAHPPRRAIFVGVANNRFEPLVNDNFDVTHTPFTSRVRQGFLRVAPHVQPRSNYDPRQLAEAMKGVGQRRSAPPTDEIVRTWAELDDLIQDKSVTFLVTSAHLDVLNVAQARGLLGLEKFRLEEITRRITRTRKSHQLADRQKVGLLEEHDPPLANINKLADPRDWESREWLVPVQRFFGGEDAYSVHNRHRDVWLHGQLVHALRGCGLNSNSDVLVVTPHSDDVYAMLSQISGQVSVCRSAFETASPAFDKKRWLDVPVLARPSRIKFLDKSLGDLTPEAFDFVVLARGSGQSRGAYGLIRALERAQRVLVPGGHVAVTLDIDVGGAATEGLIAAGDLESLLEDIRQRTGLAPVDKPDFRLSTHALDLTVNADREVDKPHFVRERTGGLVSAGMVVLRKHSNPAQDGWLAIRQSRVSWALGPTADKMQISDLYQMVDGVIRVDWDAPAGIIGRAAHVGLPAGCYQLAFDIAVDEHVPDARTILGIEVEAADDLPAVFVDVTAADARKGAYVVTFEVKAAANDDFSHVSIRLRSFGRAGLSVKPGNIRPASITKPMPSHLDLLARNALAPNAWRRGEEIIVEREAEHRHFLFGPYQRLHSGWWRLALNMSISDAVDWEVSVVELEILHGQAGQLPPGIQLTPARCAKGPVSIDIFVPETATHAEGFAGAFEFRMHFRGGGRVTVHDFALNTVTGGSSPYGWAFTINDVIDQDTGSGMVWLSRGTWLLRAMPTGIGQVSLVGDRRHTSGQFDFGNTEIKLVSPFDDPSGWLRIDTTFTDGKPHNLMMRPEHDPFASMMSVAHAFPENGDVTISADPSHALGEMMAVTTSSSAIVEQSSGERAKGVLYIGAAALAGSTLTPERRMRPMDVHFALAGARSLGRAIAFARTHRFDVARIDFADVDYNMQPIPRLRRAMALKGWVDLFSALRRSCSRIVVEIHQIEARRQGPVKSDLLRKRLFAIADEIIVHDEGALKAMRLYFPQHASRVVFSTDWVKPT